MKPRKLVSLFLAVLMVATLLPVSALADDQSATEITLAVPTPGTALPDSATATNDVTVSQIKWTVNGSEATGNAKYNTTYTVEFTLTPDPADTFDTNFEATLTGFDTSNTNRTSENSATVTATYTTAPAAAPTATIASPIEVANTGAPSQSIKLNVSGIVDATLYANNGGAINYTVTELSDDNNILTIPGTGGTLTNNAALQVGTYMVAANPANESTKTATFKISFTGNTDGTYAALPPDITVTVNLAAGNNTSITIDSVDPTDNPITKPAGYAAFELTVNATAADASQLSYAWSVDGIGQSETTKTFTVPEDLTAGNHTVTCKVTSDTNTTGVTHTFNIQVAEKVGIPVPEVKNPVYNGSPQIPTIIPSELAEGKYAVTVTSQTDVSTTGGYVLTLSLKDKNADTWLLANGTTTTEDQVLRWNVDPKPVKVFNVKATDKVYDAGTSVRITAGELKKSGNGDEAYAVLQSDAVTLGSLFRRAATSDANAGVNKAVIVSGFTLEGADAANYRLIQPDDVRVTIQPAKPSIVLHNYTAAYTGLPIQMSGAIVSGIPGGTAPNGFLTYTYYTNSACSQLTTAANGAAYVGGAPSAPGTYYVVAYMGAAGNYTSAYAYAAVLKIVTDFDVNFDITATSNRGGSISPSGTVKVASGGDKTFTFKPKAGYELVDVLVDGQSVGVVGSYTFRNVKADHTIKAIFTSEAEEEVPPVWNNPFTDVSRSDWFYASVEYAVTNGLMEGTSSASFAPAAVTTRAEMVTILWRLAGEPDAKTDAGFRDLTQNWYTEAVNWAAENDIAEGVSSTKFAPGEYITREQLVTMLYRYAAYRGYDTSAYSSFNKFVDGDAVSGFAADALHWAVSENIILGKEGKRLDPQGAASRAEIAAIFARFMKTFAD